MPQADCAPAARGCWHDTLVIRRPHSAARFDLERDLERDCADISAQPPVTADCLR